MPLRPNLPPLSTEHFGQIALLFFVGQRGLHEFGSDYVAVSYVKGYVLLTWDLGSGEQKRILRGDGEMAQEDTNNVI